MDKEIPRLEKGIIQIYFGNGKGKTTAAIGQAIRALGQGLRIYMAQFLKPMDAFSGEMAVFEGFKDHFFFRRPNHSCFLENPLPDIEMEKEKRIILDEIASIRDCFNGSLFDIFILDELLTALNLRMVEESHIIDLLETKAEHVEIILTGLKSTPRISDMADLVTEMRLIKHPYQSGLKARQGIEY